MPNNVRGLSFAASVKYVRQNFGETGLQKVLDSLPEEERKIAGGKFHPMDWYPQAIFVKFLSAADKTLGTKEHEICYLAGKANAEDAFGGIYKIFLEFGGPQALLKKAALAWRALNDTGYLEVEVSRDKYTKGKIKEYENPQKCLCVHLNGYFEKVMELSGAKNAKSKEIQCRLEGADCCEYEVIWE